MPVRAGRRGEKGVLCCFGTLHILLFQEGASQKQETARRGYEYKVVHLAHHKRHLCSSAKMLMSLA